MHVIFVKLTVSDLDRSLYLLRLAQIPRISINIWVLGALRGVYLSNIRGGLLGQVVLLSSWICFLLSSSLSSPLLCFLRFFPLTASFRAAIASSAWMYLSTQNRSLAKFLGGLFSYEKLKHKPFSPFIAVATAMEQSNSCTSNILVLDQLM